MIQIKGLAKIGQTNYAYNEHKILGEGFGGRIYEGTNLNNSCPIAVKILKKGQSLQNQISFTDMMRITSNQLLIEEKLNFSANSLATIFQVIQLDKTYLIMELFDFNLNEYLSYRQHLISQNQLISILKNVVQALLTVSKQGYYFCDLKPQNILVTKQGSAKIGDIESLIKLQESIKKNNSTYHQSIFGTLHYMAPQLIQFGQYHPKNYTWTLGVIIHEIIYGDAPFNIQSMASEQVQKQSSYNSFYKNLFNLKIQKQKVQSYPNCHKFLSLMLCFNKKKRISLEELYENLQNEQLTKQSYNQSKKMSYNLNYLKIDVQSLKGKSRSLSQMTNDSECFQSPQYLNSKSNKGQKEQNQMKINQTLVLIHEKKEHSNYQNQKQKQNIFSQEENQLSLIQSQKISQNSYLFKQILQGKLISDLMPSLQIIKSPSIFKKKLNQIKNQAEQFLKDINNVEQQSFLKQKFKHFKDQLKISKAMSHLQKTIKYSGLERDQYLNKNERKLWKILNQLIQII